MKRPPIPRKLRAQAMAKNSGICMHQGCTKPGFICEHLVPWFFVQEHKLENLEPRCREHATEKTRKDQKDIGHIRRASGETGQYARRKRNGPQIKSRGFDRSLRKKMNGTIEVRSK